MLVWLVQQNLQPILTGDGEPSTISWSPHGPNVFVRTDGTPTNLYWIPHSVGDLCEEISTIQGVKICNPREAVTVCNDSLTMPAGPKPERVAALGSILVKVRIR